MKNLNEEQEKLIDNQISWGNFFYNKKFQIILVIILCALIGIGSPFLWGEIWKKGDHRCAIESDLRYECLPLSPNKTKSEDQCREAGCCWDTTARDNQIQCFNVLVTNKDNKNTIPAYTVIDSSDSKAKLRVKNSPIYLKNQTDSNGKQTNQWFLGGPIVYETLEVNIDYYKTNHFSIKIFPEEDKRNFNFYLPEGLNNIKPNKSITADTVNAKISLVSKLNDNFVLTVKRRDTNQIIFTTGDFTPFIYSEGLIEITNLLPNDLIYGLGQSPSRGFKHNMTYPEHWSIFNKYNLNLTANQSSWYGSHPFYMGWTNDNKPYGVLLLNSFPMEIITNSRPSLTFKIVGGHLNFHFFIGDTPQDIYTQLHTIIGPPAMPPYWALGFHMCRTQCYNLQTAQNIKNQMIDKNIPYDSDCGNAATSMLMFRANGFEELTKFFDDNANKSISSWIVMVPHKANFTNDCEKLSDSDEFIEGVCKNWQKNDNSIPWLQIKDINGHKDKHFGSFYDWCAGKMESKNSSVKYPSFMEPYRIDQNTLGLKVNDKVKETIDHDLNEVMKLKGKIDGIFADYNTPLDLKYTTTHNMSQLCPVFTLNNQWNKYYYSQLNQYSPCLDVTHGDKYTIDYTTGGKTNNYTLDHLALHNLYGYQHTYAIKEVLANDKTKLQRKLVMSLSTFIGSGRLGAHIGTNMKASWDMLVQSNIQTLEFSLYGIPLTGFPVCGFKGDAPDNELCLRWYQLAALQPFMISHRDFNEHLTDPISLAKDGKSQMILDAIKSTIVIRYRLLPYFYTMFYLNHISGEPAVRPLFYEFYNDTNTFKIDKQFMWGKALMVSPVLESKPKNISAYFPQNKDNTEVWYDYYNGRRIVTKKGQTENLSAIEYHINLHVRGGRIIPTQKEGQNTYKSRQQPFTLIVALSLNGSAEGELYVDNDADKPDHSGQPDDYFISKFSVKKLDTTHNNSFINYTMNIVKTITNQKAFTFNYKVEEIKIFGVIDPLFPLQFNLFIDGNLKRTYDNNKPNQRHITYDTTTGVLSFKNITDIDMSAKSNYTLAWSFKKY
ncbi:sucrase-isomaltase, intestinal-like [Oppia nitens]|uniref:sucrase-isomaltase, intestinal-like n=1 Tax=Oppia nitens TaxID=1686743 RepID=UPI0023DA5D19|nr:sucrase-isomaltase, intestinal-like [Oppia nitens]